MAIELTTEKTRKGFNLVQQLLLDALAKREIRAKRVMMVAGFLNFVASVMKVGRPYIKPLMQGIGEAQVYSAWQSGRKRFNPVVHIHTKGLHDLTWWCLLLMKPVVRPLHAVGERVFLWHQKNPDIEEIDADIGNVDTRIRDKEQLIVNELEEDIFDSEHHLRNIFQMVANLDCLLSFANCSEDLNFVRPGFRQASFVSQHLEGLFGHGMASTIIGTLWTSPFTYSSLLRSTHD